MDCVIKAQVAVAEPVFHGASVEWGRGRQWPRGDRGGGGQTIEGIGRRGEGRASEPEQAL